MDFIDNGNYFQWWWLESKFLDPRMQRRRPEITTTTELVRGSVVATTMPLRRRTKRSWVSGGTGRANNERLQRTPERIQRDALESGLDRFQPVELFSYSFY